MVIIVFSSLGLLVACINITNLFLARVLSRTKYIGVATALGASRSDIFKEWLTKSLTIGFIGGVLGICLSLIFLKVYANLVNSSNPPGVTPTVFSLEPLMAVAGFGLSLLVSVLFGVIPAIGASQIRAAQALRS